jgi:pimeloyl-ACP methyl ester carboxylesterase
MCRPVRDGDRVATSSPCNEQQKFAVRAVCFAGSDAQPDANPSYDHKMVSSGASLSFDCGQVTLAAEGFGNPADPPVLLFHGGGQTRHSWDRTAAELGDNGWYAVNVDLRGHGRSGWSPDGDYSIDRFRDDVWAVARSFARLPVMVGASLGGVCSLLAIGESEVPVASALVLVDVAPRIERAGAMRIGDFMRAGMDGFDSLEQVADAISEYNPHRQRPSDLSGLAKNLRERDGRWYWHWDPAFITPVNRLNAVAELGATGDGVIVDGAADEESKREAHSRYTPTQRLDAAARALTVPMLLVRGGSSDLLSEEGAQELLALVPHAQFADVAGAGHMVAGDRNDRFNSAVVTFLESTCR